MNNFCFFVMTDWFLQKVEEEFIFKNTQKFLEMSKNKEKKVQESI